eukprot:TRINITY_DN2098_c0_g1_i1.p1 TRINITY_DN2098_c0_g1~~TRINITY_DN2098_c0_g1_i1.p1  ORF type:complete len:422 (+),score=85.79 TRINITY_DN2098_c0_g1_i1:162-1427(+)
MGSKNTSEIEHQTPPPIQYDEVTDDILKFLFKFPKGLDIMDGGIFKGNSLCGYHVLSRDDPDWDIVMEQVRNLSFESEELDRAIGCFMGLMCGDALGSPLEFSPVQYGTDELKGLDHDEIWDTFPYNNFRLKPGQWTDDSAMALCVADQLLCDGEFDPRALRLRFLLWWQMGYNNAFTDRNSVGLGGNISQSFSEFKCNRTEYTEAGDLKTSGNGSLMRLAAVPIFYRDNLEEALDIAYKHSKTTHQGEEAAECCRLLSYLIIQALKGDGTKNFMENIEFESDLYSIQCLAQSKQEEEHQENEGLDLQDRNWNWKDPDYKFAPLRSKMQPGYIGSYAMDGLSMALHCVYSTNSFEECLLKIANMRGDADTTAAMAGQLAGAIYGFSSIPVTWTSKVEQFFKFEGDVYLRIYRLFHKKTLSK